MAQLHRFSLTVVVLLALAGCGDDGAGPVDPAPASAAVDVGNDFFRSVANGSLDPSVDTVAVGGTVTWTWIELGEHGVIFDDPDLPIGSSLSEVGSQYSQSFSAAGTYPYTCTTHGFVMAGSVVVR